MVVEVEREGLVIGLGSGTCSLAAIPLGKSLLKTVSLVNHVFFYFFLRLTLLVKVLLDLRLRLFWLVGLLLLGLQRHLEIDAHSFAFDN